jgi:hypothetical protein
LLLPTFGSFAKKGKWGLVFLTVSISFALAAHYDRLRKGKAKNLLIFMMQKPR